MSLAAGTKLGPYEIISPLGAGGMGEVYRARDTRLGRDVAIKVLPQHLSTNPEVRTRFEREAKTVSSLNHPHICTLFDVGREGETDFLVMELIEGETLATRLGKGPLALADSLRIGIQIADALDRAHRAGVVHRDLKPGNIMLTKSGAKLMDFGLARATGLASGLGSGVTVGGLTQSPTVAQPLTAEGTIIGTFQYMAPEQLEGKETDARGDLWALGCVLYEMTTGQRAFEGKSQASLITSIMGSQPEPISQVTPMSPPALDRLVSALLAKDPSDRVQSAHDVKLQLQWMADGSSGTGAPAISGGATPAKRRGTVVPWIVAGVAIVAAAAIAWQSTRRPSVATGSVSRLSIMLPEGERLADGSMLPIALSPDGSMLTYVAFHDGRSQLFIRKLSEDRPTAFTGTEGAAMPFFSPDGKWIAFFAQGKLRKVAVGGSELQTVCEVPTQARGASWGSDGIIYFAPNNSSGLWTVPATGGTPVELTKLDRASGEVSHRWPQVIAEEGVLLYAVWTGPGAEECRVMSHSLKTGEHHVLVPGADMPRYLHAGYLLYSRRDDLFAVPWRPSQTDLGSAARVTLPEHPRMENEGAGCYAVSDNGTMVYLAGGPERYQRQLVWVDRRGETEVLPVPPRDYQSVTISPDGSRAVIQVMEAVTGLWLYDFARHTMTPLSTSGGSSQAPVWTPDGTRVIYRGTRIGTRNVWWIAADGTGNEERLTNKDAVTQTPTSVSLDGEWLVYNDGGGRMQGSGSVWMVRLHGEREPREVVQTPVAFANGQISPDGKWMAYVSNASGTMEVYIQPFPGPGASQQVSNGGGDEPRWSRSGRELFFLNRSKLMAVDVSAGSTLVIGQPRLLFEGRYRLQINGNTAYDVSLDGQRFLRIRHVTPESAEDHLEVVLNWIDQLDRLVAAK